MKTRNLLLIAIGFLVAGLISLASKWNGSAGINAGDSISAWSVTFNGSVHGWPAMIGILCVLAGLVLLVVGLIRTLLE
jgi:hypothetical protein